MFTLLQMSLQMSYLFVIDFVLGEALAVAAQQRWQFIFQLLVVVSKQLDVVLESGILQADCLELNL